MASADTTAIETVEQRAARVKKEVAQSVPANREDAPELAACIDRAHAALEAKAKVLAVVQECREYGTMTINMGRGSREQVEWILTYLPRKSRKGKEQGNGDSDE